MVVKEDDSVYDIAKTLEAKGWWRMQRCSGFRKGCLIIKGQMKPGTYLLSTAYEPSRLLAIMAGDAEQEGRGLVIVEERMRTYINSLDMGNTDFLESLEKEALSSGVPIIRREMQSFIKVLLAVKKPERILEVGTAVGFSTLLMCEYGPEKLQVTTIENYEKRIPIARENFAKAGRSHQITLLEGDAGQILRELEPGFDLIFMDAAKGQYIHWLEDAVRLLNPEGILLSDNVLQEGELIESRYLVERRNRTIYKRMRDYLYALKHDERLLTSILPLGDGAALSIRQPFGRGNVPQ